MVNKLILLLVMIFISLTFVSASICPNNIGVCDESKVFQSITSITLITNYSLVNVNNSQYLRGLTPTQVANINNASYLSTYNASYVPYTGATTDVNLGTYNLTTTGTGTFRGLNITNGSISDFNPQTNIIQSLGSSVKRWLKGWFQDLDVLGNLNVSGNITASKFIGDGSSPPGMISAYGGTSAPTGWLMCDGSRVSRTTYADLFSVIGFNFGADPGYDEFYLPALVGDWADPLYIVGVVTGTYVGSIGGTQGTNSAFAQITDDSGHTHSISYDTVEVQSGSGQSVVTFIAQPQTGYASGLSDSGHWHDGIMPTAMRLNFIIKT